MRKDTIETRVNYQISDRVEVLSKIRENSYVYSAHQTSSLSPSFTTKPPRPRIPHIRHSPIHRLKIYEIARCAQLRSTQSPERNAQYPNPYAPDPYLNPFHSFFFSQLAATFNTSKSPKLPPHNLQTRRRPHPSIIPRRHEHLQQTQARMSRAIERRCIRRCADGTFQLFHTC